MSNAVLKGHASGTGTVTIETPNTNSDLTISMPAGTGTVVVNGVNSAVVRGTSVASTSGTSIDFTNIPSWVKRITVMFNGVSLNGTASPLVQLGTSGTPTTSGYVSTTSYTTTPNGTGSPGGLNVTSGFIIQSGNDTYVLYGSIAFTNLSGNIWVAQGCFANINTVPLAITSAGGITLGGVLNMLRITTNNGTDIYDAGSINILYE